MGMIIRPGHLGRRAGLGTARGWLPQNAFGAAEDFNPLTIPNLGTWYHGESGVTLGGTPLASGTVPPVVTLTGTLTPALGLYVQIDGAGARGVATFKWSLDNGSTFAATGVLTAATVTLTGLAAAITVNFPVGAYLTDNIYKATIAQWNDVSGNGNNTTQAAATAQPQYIADAAKGRSGGLFVQASSQFLQKTNVNLFGAGAYCVFGAVKYVAAAANAIAFANSATGVGMAAPYANGTSRAVVHVGVAAYNDATVSTGVEIWTANRVAASKPTLRVNKTVQALAGAATTLNDPGGTASLLLGCHIDTGTPQICMDGHILEILAYTRDLTTTEVTKVENYLTAKYR